MTDIKEKVVELLQGRWVDNEETYEIEIVDEKSYFLDWSGKVTNVPIELKFVELTINRWLLTLHSLMDGMKTFLYDISETEMTLYIYGSKI